MNDPNSFGYQANPGAPTGPERGFPGGPSAMAQYKFSAEEMRVLQECNRESFFKRSVPLATVLGLSTFAGIQRGFLRPNPRFGAFPKMTFAVAVGYFIGKLSYQQACAEKLMALPGSYIGQLLRDRRDGKIGGENIARAGGTAGAGGMLGAAATDIYSDAGPGSSLDLDTDRPAFTDDTYRPDREGASGGAGVDADAVPSRPALSYDELRRRNRGEHADAKQDPYRVDGGVRRSPPPPPPPIAPRPPATNRYGDPLD